MLILENPYMYVEYVCYTTLIVDITLPFTLVFVFCSRPFYLKTRTKKLKMCEIMELIMKILKSSWTQKLFFFCSIIAFDVHCHSKVYSLIQAF